MNNAAGTNINDRNLAERPASAHTHLSSQFHHNLRSRQRSEARNNFARKMNSRKRLKDWRVIESKMDDERIGGIIYIVRLTS